MRKITALLLFITASSFAQQDKDNYIAFTAGFDVRNAIVGSTPTADEPALNYQLQFAMVSNNIEVNLGYEAFPRIDYDRYHIGVGYHFHLYGYALGKALHTTFIPTLEPSLIGRHGTWGGGLSYNQTSSHLSVGLSLAFRWNINDNLSFGYRFNALPRTDLSAMYGEMSTRDRASIAGIGIVGSNFLDLTYRLDLTKGSAKRY